MADLVCLCKSNFEQTLDKIRQNISMVTWHQICFKKKKNVECAEANNDTATNVGYI
jgi:hypothetical protein